MSGEKIKRVDTSSQKQAAEAARQARYAANNKRDDGTAVSQHEVMGDSGFERNVNRIFVYGPMAGTAFGVGKAAYKSKKAGNSVFSKETGARILNKNTAADAEQLEKVMNKKAAKSAIELKNAPWYSKRRNTKLLEARQEFFKANKGAGEVFSKLSKCQSQAEYNALKSSYGTSAAQKQLFDKVEEYFKKNEKVDFRETAFRRGEMGTTIDAHKQYLNNGHYSYKEQRALKSQYKNLRKGKPIGYRGRTWGIRNSAKGFRGIKRGVRGKGGWIGLAIMAGFTFFSAREHNKVAEEHNSSMQLSAGNENKLNKSDTEKGWFKSVTENIGYTIVAPAQKLLGKIPVIGPLVTWAGGQILPATTYGTSHLNDKVLVKNTASEEYEEELTKKFASGSMTETEMKDFVEIQKRRNKDILTGNIGCTSEEQMKTLQDNQIKVNKALIALGYNPIPDVNEVDMIVEETGENLTAEARDKAVKLIRAQRKAENKNLDYDLDSMSERKLKEKCDELGIKIEGKFTKWKAKKAIKAKLHKPTSKREIRREVLKMPANEIYKILGYENEYKAMVLGVNKEAVIDEYKNEAKQQGVELTDEDIAQLEAQIDKEIDEAYDEKAVHKASLEENTARLTMSDEEFEKWEEKQLEKAKQEEQTAQVEASGISSAQGVTRGDAVEDSEVEQGYSENMQSNTADGSVNTQNEYKKSDWLLQMEAGFGALGNRNSVSMMPDMYSGLGAGVAMGQRFNFNNSLYNNNFGNSYNGASLWSYSQPFSAYQFDNGQIGQMPLFMSMNPYLYGINNGQTMA